MHGHPPVIIIGMHRSGTSMITNILENLGLFIGYKKDPNQEAWLFLRLNQWILSLCDATWHNPTPIDELLACDDVRSRIVAYLQFHLHSPRIVNYLGIRRFLQSRDIFNLNFSWGWKDPQNTFTLPLWLDLFGQVRVIHIYRNGIDVANSLVKRSQATHTRSIKTLERWQDWDAYLAYNLLPIQPSFKFHRMTLEDGFNLWETYTERAISHTNNLPDERIFSVSYEAFIEKPLDWTNEICKFLDLQVSLEQMHLSIKDIKYDRRFVFNHDPRLHDLYQAVKKRPLMAQLGYYDID